MVNWIGLDWIGFLVLLCNSIEIGMLLGLLVVLVFVGVDFHFFIVTSSLPPRRFAGFLLLFIYST